MRNIFLVFRRDYFSYISAWGFWLGLLAMPLLLGLGAFAGAFAAATTPTRYYAVIESEPTYGPAIEAEFQRQLDEAGELAERLVSDVGKLSDDTANAAVEQIESQLPKFVRVDAPALDLDTLRPWLLGERQVDGPAGSKPLFAVIIVPPGEGEIEYWSAEANVPQLLAQVTRATRAVARARAFEAVDIDPNFLDTVYDAAPSVKERIVRTEAAQAESGNEVTLADRAPLYIAIGLAYFLWLIIFSVIQYLLMGTIEERSNKIFDTLLTAVKLPQLLAGKLIATFAVTSTMMGSWALAGGLAIAFGASAMPPEVRQSLFEIINAGLQPSLLLPAALCLVLGYLMYGVIFMALGSLCDTIQEAQTLISPMMILLMLPMFMIVLTFSNPESGVVAIVSWIPLFTPFLLMLRIPAEPPLWEILGQLALTGATTAIIMHFATKVYRAGAVHGAGVSDATAWLKRFIPGTGKKAKTPAAS